MLSDKKKVYGIILEKEVHEEIKKIAEKEDRSISYKINDVLKKYIESQK